jgi:cell division protein FtsQ
MSRKQAKKRKPRKSRSWKKITLPMVRIAKLAVAAAIVALTYEVSARLLDQPIRAITIDGPFQRVSALQIEEALSAQLDGGFLSANLDDMREQIMALPWIDQATVARRWPATLEVRVTEQVPAACWGENGLLNTRGELFVTDARHVPAELPRLSGPEHRSAEVAKTYLDLRERLIPMGLDLRRVNMDARGAWDVTLQNGVDVRLGRKDVADRIELFLDVVADLVSSREAEIDYVDMRYSNGFTIGWTGSEPVPAGTAQPMKEMLAVTTSYAAGEDGSQ